MLGPRPPIVRSASTQAFVDSLLGDLAAGAYSPAAWFRFAWRSWRRSLEAARRQRRAALEVHLLHLALLTLGTPRWVIGSWLLAWSHVGLLGDQPRSLGVANLLTLLRANLPALRGSHRAWVASAALGSDLADGWIARAGSRETGFGAYADALADLTFWTWFAYRHEPSRLLRGLALSLWLTPAAALIVWYFGAARAIDVPRPQVTRLASAGFQLLLAARAWARWARSRRQATFEPSG
ncbi:MAG: CDP-alcohol phosphatidyltransferase family protein [Candidatus Dormibacteraeota bacterium]|uniref:CDP-alcohol phosphatidyltransferase family protein n=1 Tax=Candidatus Dormiibacter inghamiae TaxID=3127013 RepID=A0A934KG46_9BACT|nr:CDP-alcohol phosphatidyltransferase family protein [Candidatus Dormibacteraeota bacterium]MBJ7604871.1 CDP-alcohol phosphatidyltransferase family protein [Candidatus Dormibacteraeota bacterium]